MILKPLGIIILLLCLSSCDYFDKKKVYSKDIIDEELKTFNWNEVDNYPSFASCEDANTKAEREACFRTTITNHITSHLNKKTVVVTKAISDTIIIKFSISETGNISIQGIESDSLTKVQIPNIDKILVESIADMPNILPAIKRGQEVKTAFKLPVIISVD